jgi:hypothetical protein
MKDKKQYINKYHAPFIFLVWAKENNTRTKSSHKKQMMIAAWFGFATPSEHRKPGITRLAKGSCGHEVTGHLYKSNNSC